MEFAGTARPPRMMRLRHRYRARTAASGSQARLRDGSAVLIRPIRSSDAPLLAEGFARLSARSRWMRFLTVKNELTPTELRYLTDIDHRDHEALGALSRDGRGVGVARYVRDKRTRARPKSRSRSPMTGKAGAWAASCRPGCRSGRRSRPWPGDGLGCRSWIGRLRRTSIPQAGTRATSSRAARG
jgi:hypothetical protein